MPSNKRPTRESQKAHDEQAIAKRLALLKEKGLAPDKIRKDPYLKHLKANFRKTISRLEAIDAIDKQKEALAIRKQKKAEQEAEEKKAGKPAKPAPEPAKKDKKEKKAKQKPAS
jgi:hypothetical protein